MTGPEDASVEARADLCRFLAACYYEPEAQFIEEGLFDSMAAAARGLEEDLARRAAGMGAAFRARPLEELRVDYTRLFLGPVDAPAKPYGSVWLGGGAALMQDSTVDVMRLYGEGGFEMAGDFRELPDHIAAELEFLYLLISQEGAARRRGNAAAADQAVDLRLRFLEGHLGEWVGPFAKAVEASAQTEFYRELARLTERFVRGEARLAGALP